jgi:hypothetical protein
VRGGGGVRSAHTLAAGLALVLAGALAAPLAARPQEPDPFYLDLQRSAAAALTRGDAAEAARKLRIACFGLLDAPDQLGGCLARLAIAQGRTADREGFTRTFERLDALVGRFHVDPDGGLEGAEKQELESRLVDWVATGTLAARPAFARLAWPQVIDGARSELDAGRPANALKRLEGIPVEVEEGLAWCLRGEALARLARCPEALSAFAACRPEVAARSTSPALACLVETGRLAEANALAARLSEPVRADRQVRRRLDELKDAGRRASTAAAPHAP